MQQAAKAVIATTDSGAPLELIQHGENGLICEPAPKAIAAAMDLLYEDREAAKKMGGAAAESATALGMGWDHVLNRLVS